MHQQLVVASLIGYHQEAHQIYKKKSSRLSNSEIFFGPTNSNVDKRKLCAVLISQVFIHFLLFHNVFNTILYCAKTNDPRKINRAHQEVKRAK